MKQQIDNNVSTEADAAALELLNDIKKEPIGEVDVVSPSSSIVFAIDPLKIAKTLLYLVIVLSVTGTIANTLIFQVFSGPEHKVSRLLNRFDLGHEPSIPAFYSSFALLAAAVLLGVIFYGERRHSSVNARYWGVLALTFVALAIDETVMFHEMFVNAIQAAFDLHGIFYFSWVIPGMAFVAVLGLVYLRFLWRLDRRTRRRLILAGAFFVGGAIGMEMVAGIIVENYGVASLKHTAVQTVEETCEMIGVVVLIYALLSYLETHWCGVQLTFPGRASQTNETAGHEN